MNNRKFIIIILVILILPNVFAFGATSPYWKDRPLIMNPREEKIVPIILQNMVGKKDIILKAEILSEKEIVEIQEPNEYFVPLGRNDIKADIKIKIPKNARKNDNYTVTILFKTIPEENGMLQLSANSVVSFPILIEEIQKSPKTNKSEFIQQALILTIIMATIITLIIIYVIRKNKNF